LVGLLGLPGIRMLGFGCIVAFSAPDGPWLLASPVRLAADPETQIKAKLSMIKPFLMLFDMIKILLRF
jgi:hypothetical protein